MGLSQDRDDEETELKFEGSLALKLKIQELYHRYRPMSMFSCVDPCKLTCSPSFFPQANSEIAVIGNW